MRRLVTFPCMGETLAGTLDAAPGTTGLLIVSGGNELRIGAHRGQALLAAAIAAAGHPVLRFDRRGIGDSTGTNEGFRSSAPDIAAAAAALRDQAGVTRIVAFGNCDAATALALFHGQAGINRLVLANPWIVEPSGDLPPPAAIRATYAARLSSPAEWKRLATGGVNLRRLAQGLVTLATSRRGQSGLSGAFAAAFGGTPADILLATGDNTAIAFLDTWHPRQPATVHRRDSDSHSFARPGDADWLRDRLLDALSRD
ncbi:MULTISPECIES: hydrolase 1, exosortase A system-associated [unclassified Sphingomonas]|uniref:hydrolase 1, exosortase A system-associated n=1 Tax=unclassified Sphingomonas TaxID=196159 RepID=UPI0006FC469C|nr:MULTISPECIES: hydrolase 1, exosortase A system-associated [unclassified Sphingomonas]KQM67092.1 alpha/beta hydrolase [Sphingomonas sp. Leaf16]KQN18027.1 alpha/beta hydrolase [Sphingomonas sp. Leaf29]KQN23962.1 alpha/beta hydrolase [Sphingomonas sp. Leaf32]